MTRKVFFRRHSQFGLLNCLRKVNDLGIKAGAKYIKMESLKSEAELLQVLKHGAGVYAYKGVDLTRGRSFPQAGTILSTPYVPKEKKLSELEQLAEAVRQSDFPECTSRLGCVFAASSVLQARFWGIAVVVVLMKLRKGIGSFAEEPVCWLDMECFDKSVSSRDKADVYGYWNSIGSHQSRKSEILVDPLQVELKVVLTPM